MGIFKVAVLPALLYCAETWDATEAQLSGLRVQYNNFLRDITGSKWWQYQSTEDLLFTTHMPPFERYTASRVLRWFGHVERMDITHRDAKLFLSPDLLDCEEQQPTAIRSARRTTFKTAVDRAMRTAIQFYPDDFVPTPLDIVTNRVEWRKFSSAHDDGTTWDFKKRTLFYERFKGLCMPHQNVKFK